MYYFTQPGQRDFEDRVKTVNFKIERVSWIILMGPVLLHEPLKTEGGRRAVREMQPGKKRQQRVKA